MIERNVHHQGQTPSRTCLGGAVDYTATHGKWAISFQTWRGIPGDEYMVHDVTSGAVFETEDDAYKAGDRALDTLQATGKYPNMCEVW